MNIIVTFKSRNQAMLFSSLLTQSRVPNKVINTPRNLSASCGLSVKLSKTHEIISRRLLSEHNFDSLGGIYVVNV